MAHFSAATIKYRLADELSYFLRLALCGALLLRYSLRIQRAAYRDAVVVTSLNRQLQPATRYSTIRSIAFLVFYPARVFGSLAGDLPMLAGRAETRFLRDLLTMHERFRLRSDGNAAPRLRLREQIAKDRKKSHVAYEFRSVFGLNLIEGQASTFSNYGQLTELFCDFLDFSITEKQLTTTNVREILASSLPEFEQSVRTHLNGHALPPRGTYRKAQPQPRGAWHAITNADYSMSGYYDQTGTLRRAIDAQSTSPWVAAIASHHVSALGKLLILRFDAILSCEIHLRTCVSICKVASKISQPTTEMDRSIRMAFTRSLENARAIAGL